MFHYTSFREKCIMCYQVDNVLLMANNKMINGDVCHVFKVRSCTVLESEQFFHY